MLCTVEDVQALPEFDTSAYDESQIETAISTIDAQIKRYCGRDFEATDYTHVLDGNGQDELYLPQFPLISVTTVKISDSEITDYVMLTESLYRSSKWTSGRRNIEITYRAGYETVPADLVNLAARMSADMLRDSGSDGRMESERFDNYSYTRSAPDVVGSYADELSAWRVIPL